MPYMEVKAPEQVKFEKPGDTLEGVLLAITVHKVKDKNAVQYMVQKDGGDRVTFLGTWDLSQKINKSMIGCKLFIKFEGLHDSIERNGNRAKLFKVMIDRSVSVPVDDLTITDEGIPF